ncbi:MAG: transposase [Candidatus Dormibacteraeota bacterium]|nr:transposase [Candidatus Dormibacteraeota bacterium]
MTVEGRLNAAKFIEFLKRLLHNSPEPIFLIVDEHPAQRAASVKQFVATSQGRLRLFYLPGYAPELNPDESVWRYVKTHNLGRARVSGPDDLKLQALASLATSTEDAGADPRLLQSTYAVLRGGLITSDYFRSDWVNGSK